MGTTRRSWLKGALAAAMVAATSGYAVAADDTIKVGILHSLSGTMAISETILKDVMLMQIAELNAKGGCSARRLSRWWSTRPRTGRCSPKRRAS